MIIKITVVISDVAATKAKSFILCNDIGKKIERNIKIVNNNFIFQRYEESIILREKLQLFTLRLKKPKTKCTIQINRNQTRIENEEKEKFKFQKKKKKDWPNRKEREREEIRDRGNGGKARRQRRQSGVKWKSEHGHVGYLRCVAGLSIRPLMLDYGRGGNLCRPSAGIKACSQRPPRHRQPATGYSLWISRVNGRASAPVLAPPRRQIAFDLTIEYLAKRSLDFVQ